MSGTVNVARALWDDPTFKDSEMSQREAWIWMIAEARWKNGLRRIGVHEVTLERGQLAASTRFMAKAWMWSEPRVRRYLDMLENRRMIERATDAGITVITICKYDDYQNVPCVGDAASTQQPTQHRRSTDANENKGVIRGKDIHGGDGSAREPESDGQTLRESILTACGADPITGLTGPNGNPLGNRTDMHTVEKWQTDLGLSPETIVAVIRDTMARKRDGPPGRLTYFTKAMQREAAERTAPRLEPAKYDPDPDTAQQRPAYRSGASRAHDNLAAGFARAVSKFQG